MGTEEPARNKCIVYKVPKKPYRQAVMLDWGTLKMFTRVEATAYIDRVYKSHKYDWGFKVVSKEVARTADAETKQHFAKKGFLE